MVQIITPEQEDEPDIRPCRRTSHIQQQLEETAAQHAQPLPPTTDENTQAVSDVLPLSTNQLDNHKQKDHQPLTYTQSATTSNTLDDTISHIYAIDYAKNTNGNNTQDRTTGPAPLKSILGVAARFKKRNTGLEPNEGSRSETDLVLDKETIPVPVRSASATPSNRVPLPLHPRFQEPPHHEKTSTYPVYTPEVESIPLAGIQDVPPRPTKSIAELFTPDRKLGTEPTWSESLKNTVKSSYINYLIPIIPVAWVLHFTHQSDTIVFVFSFIAVIPLASLLCFATEELALRLGDALGGLLNASFGNAVEIIISVLALVKGEIGLVQASMIGSILSNTLLVLGMCFCFGGLRFHEQIYAVAAAQLQISLLGIAMCSLVLPAAYHFSVSAASGATGPQLDIADLAESEQDSLLSISRGLSFMLLATYGAYLVFQLYTHTYLFKRQPRAMKRPHHAPGAPRPAGDKVFPIPSWLDSIRSHGSSTSSSSDGRLTPTTSRDAHDNTLNGDGESPTVIESMRSPSILESQHTHQRDDQGEDEEDEEVEKPKVKVVWAFVLLCGVTAITGVTAEFLLDSVNGLTESTSISKEFVGLILLPIVSNSVEHVAAVTVSVKDKLDLSMAIAVGSSIQVALAILPILVLVGWIIGQPMSLFFDTFETITLVISLLLVNFTIGAGRADWVKGVNLMITYAMIALVCWYYNPSSYSTSTAA